MSTKKQTISKRWITALTLPAAALAFTACDIDKIEDGEMPDVDVQVEEGNLPDYEVIKTEDGKMPKVDVDVEGGKLPKYDVEGPDVDVKTKKIEVEVPDVDVTLPKDDDRP